jgi:putative ABC transport system ATP-binding protein
LHKEGNTIVLITHDNSIAMQAQRIIRLQDGRVIHDGQTSEEKAFNEPSEEMTS